MTEQEFSQELDIIYENINSGDSIGLDEYEKSVILTQAQEAVIMKLSDGDLVPISKLVKTAVFIEAAPEFIFTRIDTRTKVFKISVPVFKPIREMLREVGVKTNQTTIVAIDYATYGALMIKPYTLPKRRTAYRLVNDSADTTPDLTPDKTVVEVLTTDETKTYVYVLTYIKMPKPIILETLDTEFIRGEQRKGVGELDAALHPTILEYAATIAEKYYFDNHAPQQAQQQPQQ